MYRSTTKMKRKMPKKSKMPMGGRGAMSDFEAMLMRQARMRPTRTKGGGGR